MVASGWELQSVAPQLGDHDLEALAEPQPGDDEMVEHLERRVADGRPSPGSFIREMNVHSAAPWDIFGDGKEPVWCFSPGPVGNGKVGRAPSASGERCWHQQRGKEEILSRDKKSVVAYRRTQYYSSISKVQTKAGEKTRYSSLGWTMVEIWLNQPDQQLALCKVYRSNRKKPKTTMAPAACAAPEPRPPEHLEDHDTADADQQQLVLGKVDRSHSETAMAGELCESPEHPRPKERRHGPKPKEQDDPRPKKQRAASKRKAMPASSPIAMLPAAAAVTKFARPTLIWGQSRRVLAMPQICHKPMTKGTQLVVGQHKAVAEETRRGGAGAKHAMRPTVVMKFCSSSLASAERINQVAAVLSAHIMETPVVVLSAIGDTPDKLLQAGRQAMSCDAEEVHKIDELGVIIDFHLSIVRDLGLRGYIFSDIFDSLKGELKDIAKKKNPSLEELECLLSFGERLPTTILYALMNERGTKARQYHQLKFGVATTDKHTNILQEICSAIAEQLVGDYKDDPAMPIVAGSLVKEWASRAVTTLERGVSDLTAIIIGRALGSREIQIWKDVDSVLTCDPNICSNAMPIHFLTFDEEAKLASFGSKVLDPQARRLARKVGIPVRVKNLNNPHSPGTLITKTRDMSKSTLIFIGLEPNFTVLDIESKRKLGQYGGFEANVLLILEGAGISVDYMATDKGQMLLALDLSRLLSDELIQPVLDKVVQELRKTAVVHVLQRRSIVSLVGNKEMSPFILLMASTVLWRIGVKVRVISPGSSNSEVMKISLVVHDIQAEDCVKALHSAFFENGFVQDVENPNHPVLPGEGDNVGDPTEPFMDIQNDNVPLRLRVDGGDSARLNAGVTPAAEDPIALDHGGECAVPFPPGTGESGAQLLGPDEIVETPSALCRVLLETSQQEMTAWEDFALKNSACRPIHRSDGDSTGLVPAEPEADDSSGTIEFDDRALDYLSDFLNDEEAK